MEKDALINFADLTRRERLEYEVSQLADGTLPVRRRASVLAEVARDASLQAMLKDFEQINARLARQPDWEAVDLAALENSVMEIVRRDLATEDASMPLRLPTTAPAATGTTGRAWWTNPWSSAVAAAAALVIGLGIGAIISQDAGPGTLQVDGPQVGVSAGGAAMATGELDVRGPGAAWSESLAKLDGSERSLAETEVLSVDGPGGGAYADSVAEFFGASSVVQTPSRVVVASVDGSSETE